MTEFALDQPSPEAILRQEILTRTLAPLVAAQQATHVRASELGSSAHHQQSVALYSGQQADVGSYRNLVEAEGIKWADLETRKTTIAGIVSRASLEELGDPDHEFDPFKADFIDKTIEELVGPTGMKPAKREAHIGRITEAAARAYDANPLHPYLDTHTKESLRRRGKGWGHWVIGALIDKI